MILHGFTMCSRCAAHGNQWIWNGCETVANPRESSRIPAKQLCEFPRNDRESANRAANRATNQRKSAANPQISRESAANRPASRIGREPANRPRIGRELAANLGRKTLRKDRKHAAERATPVNYSRNRVISGSRLDLISISHQKRTIVAGIALNR